MRFILLLSIGLLSSCSIYRVITPQEALVMCNGEVKRIETMIGKIICRDK